MKFEPPFEKGTFIRRYKRFLADVISPEGEQITIHCPNTGSMKACLNEGSSCWYSYSENPKRKYPCTWEIATTPEGHLAGINTARANDLVVEGIKGGLIKQLQGYDNLRKEVRYGDENSRIDILLEKQGDLCYVEVKNVTLCRGEGAGLFPDAVTTRGAKHLRELELMVQQGNRAVLMFCVQHSGIESVTPAVEIDPAYANAFQQAIDSGVEVFAYKAAISSSEIVLNKELPVIQL